MSLHRSALALLTAAALALPVAAPAQTDATPGDRVSEGFRMLLEGLSDGLDGTLEDLGAELEGTGPALRSFLREMGPAFRDLLAEIKDFSNYHPPQVLPNGDILIRRKEDNPEPYMPPIPGQRDDGSVDL